VARLFCCVSRLHATHILLLIDSNHENMDIKNGDWLQIVSKKNRVKDDRERELVVLKLLRKVTEKFRKKLQDNYDYQVSLAIGLKEQEELKNRLIRTLQTWDTVLER